jgi:hypothetical protein
VTVTLINSGDRPLTYRVTPPRGVVVSQPPGELPGLASRDLRVTVDATDYEPGRYSVGGLRIDALSASGRPAEGSPMIVPLGLELLAPSGSRNSEPHPVGARTNICLPLMLSQQSAAILRTYVPPADILVHGEAQTGGRDQVRAIHGVGWYELEASNGRTMRWAESPAEVYVYSPVKQEAMVRAVPVALHEDGAPWGEGDRGTMAVRINDQPGATFEVHTDAAFTCVTRLRGGWNVVSFELEAGNFRPVDVDPESGDQRSLSFALRGLDINLR